MHEVWNIEGHWNCIFHKRTGNAHFSLFHCELRFSDNVLLTLVMCFHQSSIFRVKLLISVCIDMDIIRQFEHNRWSMRMYASVCVYVCVCVTFWFEYLDKRMNARKQNAYDLMLVYSNQSTDFQQPNNELYYAFKHW